jgi:PKD repeat protein
LFFLEGIFFDGSSVKNCSGTFHFHQVLAVLLEEQIVLGGELKARQPTSITVNRKQGMKMLNKSLSVLFIAAILCSSLSFVVNVSNVYGETFLGWQVAEGPYGIVNGTQYTYGGKYSESNGTFTLSGDTRAAGPTLFKEISPKTDFEISLQIKAETLSQVGGPLSGGSGEGFRLMLQDKGVNPTAGINFELRGRAGGEFWMVWHNPRCDLYGWQCDIVPFVYNTEYQNAPIFSPPQNTPNAIVRPGVWYTMKLRVHQSPYTMTGKVYAENGTLLGHLTIDDINNFSFKDIKVVEISTLCGGTFYVRNISIADIPPVETFQGWQVGPEGGEISESNGTLTFSGGISCAHIEPCLFKEFTPKGDFEISFQLKAETLGEVLVDQAGEGFVFSFGSINMTSLQFRVVSLWLRARAGGQFLLAWHDKLCDLYDWGCNWEPFVYNGIGYNNGYEYWHPNPPQDRSNAPVKPDVWYTLKLKVHETPFTVTGEVYAENGTLLGSLTIDCMNDLTFKDIKYVYMSTGAGGTFYVRNITGIGPDSDFVFAPEEAVVGSPVAFNASENASSYGQALNYIWDFGDGNTTVTQQQTVTHAYASPGTFSVTLTVTDSMGEHSSSVHSIRARIPTYLSISTESSFSMVGSTVNVNGKLLDASSVGLANEPVVLQYTFPGTTSWFPISSAFTNAAGDYSIQWINPATGSFTLKAEWAGNGTHVGAVNTTTLSSLPYQNQNVFFVESNSTVYSLAFNSTSLELSFTVSGPSGTTGYSKATIAKTLMANAENLKVYVDGNQLTYFLTETANSWLLTFNYSHSTHQVSVYLPTNIPSTSNLTPLASASDSPILAPTSNTTASGVDYGPWIAAISVIAATAIISAILFSRRKPT